MAPHRYDLQAQDNNCLDVASECFETAERRRTLVKLVFALQEKMTAEWEKEHLTALCRSVSLGHTYTKACNSPNPLPPRKMQPATDTAVAWSWAINFEGGGERWLTCVFAEIGIATLKSIEGYRVSMEV